MFGRAANILSEAVMGFLALGALSLGLVPLLFPISPAVAAGLDVAEWIVVGLFALEYVAHLAVAPDRRRYLADPWRLLDAAIILAALGSLLPFIVDPARNAALRILRLSRALLFGFRPGVGCTEPVGAAAVRSAAGHRIGRPTAPRPAEWDESAYLPTHEWLRFNLMLDRLRDRARWACRPWWSRRPA
jgi:hypothetical protein